MLALGMVAACVLLVAATMTTLLRGSEKSVDRSTGAVLADAVITETLAAIYSNPTDKANFFAGTTPYSGTVILAGTTYTWELTHQTITRTAVAGGGDLGDGVPENRVKKVNCVVWWWTADPDQQRDGYGYLRTEVSRLVNENDDL